MWKKTVSVATIALTSSKASATGVSMTVQVNTPTVIQQGYVVFTFPELFDVSHVTSVNGTVSVNGNQVFLLMDIQSDDISIQIDNITNPLLDPLAVCCDSPLAIETRRCLTCGAEDINHNLGFFYIIAPKGMSNLQVNFAAGNVGLGAVANFSLSYTSNGMFYGNSLRLQLASYWRVNGVAQCKLTISSQNQSPITYSSNCSDADSGVVTYPSVLTDVVPGSIVNLIVNGVTAPPYPIPPEDMTWTLYAYQSDLAHVFELGNCTGGPTMQGGQFQSVSWQPTTPPGDLRSGMWRYMDLSFTTYNAIPAGGVVEIELPGARKELYGAPCFVKVPNNSSLDCVALDKATLTIPNLPIIPKNSVFVIRTYTQLMQRPFSQVNIIRISSYPMSGSNSSLYIDQITQYPVLTLGAYPFSNLIDLRVTFNEKEDGGLNSLNVAGGTGDAILAVFVSLFFSSYQPYSGSSISISCPWQLSSNPTDADITFPHNLDVAWSDSSDFSVQNQFSHWEFAKKALSVTFSSIPTSSQVFIRLSTDSDFITLPQAASNPASVYECFASINGAGNALLGANRFDIRPNVWSGKVVSRCMPPINGVPAIFELGGVLAIPEYDGNKEYFVDFIATDLSVPMDSEVTVGDDWPHSWDSGVQQTVLKYTDLNTFTLSNFTHLSKAGNSALPLLSFPLGTVSQNSIDWNVQSYYILNNQTNVKYITQGYQYHTPVSFTSQSDFPFESLQSPTSFTNRQSNELQVNLTLDAKDGKGVIYVPSLKPGSTWTNPSLRSAGLQGVTGFYYNITDNWEKNSGAAWITTPNSDSVTGVISGITPPLGATNDYTVTIGYSSLAPNCPGTYLGSKSFNVISGSLGVTLVQSYSCAKSSACSVSVDVTLAHGVAVESILNFTMPNMSWKVPSTVCTANTDTNTHLPCSLNNGFGVVIFDTQLSANTKVTVRFGPLKTPNNSGQLTLITAAQTQLSTTQVIDIYSGSPITVTVT